MRKVLFVDVNASYINPSASLFPALVRTAFPNVDFYGPGYVSDPILIEGIQRWIERRGGYGFVIFGPNTAVYADEDQIRPTVTFISKFTVNRLAPTAVSTFFSDVLRAYKTLEIPIKAVATINLDSYAMPASWIERMEKDRMHLIGPNHQFHRRVEELPEYVGSEKHYAKLIKKPTDDYYNFLANHQERVLTSTHFVCASEFRFDALAIRPNTVAVPGVEYVQRKEALRELRTTRFKVASKWYFHVFSGASRAGLPVFSKNWSQRTYQLLFQNTLASSRFVYTARDASGIPLRKFFEIPAAGAVLVCDPINGFSDLGYQSNIHYLSAHPKDLPDILYRYDGTEEAQLIAWEGQRRTMASHSLSARADQLRECVTALLERRFLGARWENGEYRVSKAITCG